MDKLSDFFAEIKNRTTNPLLVSFFISWPIINWKITIGLFTNISTLKTDGYNSYIQLIEKNSDKDYTLWYPLLAATVYTIIFPWIKLGVLALNTFAKRLSTDLNLRLSKDGKVPMKKYLTIRESYIERQKQLQQILEQDEQYLKQNSDLLKEKNELSSKNLELNNLIQANQKSINDLNFLAGEWTYYQDINSMEGIRITIRNNEIRIHNGEKEAIKYRIQDFYHDKFHERIILSRFNVENPKQIVFHTLNYKNGSINELTGFENNTTQIRYVKIK